MSKDVVIAGVIVAACLGLVVVAFTLPKKSDKVSTAPATDTPIASTTDTGSSAPGLPGESGAGATGFDTGFGSTTGGGFGTTPPSTGFGSTTGGGFGTTPPGTGFGSTTGGGFGTTPPSTGFGSTTGGGFGTTPNAGGFGTTPPSTGFGTLPPAVTPGVTPGTAVDATAAAVTSGEKTHVVAKGETLGDISMKYYNTSKHWKKIAEANKVDPAGLQVGAKLTIPEIAQAAPATGAAAGAEAGGDATYKIKPGDTYYTVAKKELGSAAKWKELEKLNKIAPEDLRVGMTIKLPRKADAAPAPGAEPAPGVTVPGATDGRTHVVAAGETLGDISRKHYGTTTKWREIAKANPGVEPETLKVGQKLVIPEIAGLKPTVGSEPAPGGLAAPAGGGAEYVVKPGDTLDEIARKQLGSKKDAKKILDANPGLDPRRLRIGQKIVIPGKSAGGDGAPPVVPMTPAPADAGGFPAFPPAGGGGTSAPAGNPFIAPPPAVGNPDLGVYPFVPPPPKPAAPATSPMP